MRTLIIIAGLLGAAAMGDETDNKLRSSVAIAQGQIFIRTGKKLYCVAKQGR